MLSFAISKRGYNDAGFGKRHGHGCSCLLPYLVPEFGMSGYHCVAQNLKHLFLKGFLCLFNPSEEQSKVGRVESQSLWILMKITPCFLQSKTCSFGTLGCPPLPGVHGTDGCTEEKGIGLFPLTVKQVQCSDPPWRSPWEVLVVISWSLDWF